MRTGAILQEHLNVSLNLNLDLISNPRFKLPSPIPTYHGIRIPPLRPRPYNGRLFGYRPLCGLKHSMKVTIADFNQETLDLAKKNLKGDVTCVKTDVGDRAEWKKLKEKVGDVDFLMLNAGVGGAGKWGDEEYFDRVRMSLMYEVVILRLTFHRFSTQTSTAS
jgi:hypothetical protein